MAQLDKALDEGMDGWYPARARWRHMIQNTASYGAEAPHVQNTASHGAEAPHGARVQRGGVMRYWKNK